MTIRAKLYAAIVLTILGPLATTAVALYGMAQLGDRFDEVRARSENEALARELKFLVTDVNGWQTAYGYGDGELRGRFARSAAELRTELVRAEETFSEARERALLTRLSASSKGSCELDRSPGARCAPGAPRRRSGSCSAPSSTASRRWRLPRRSWRAIRPSARSPPTRSSTRLATMPVGDWSRSPSGPAW